MKRRLPYLPTFNNVSALQSFQFLRFASAIIISIILVKSGLPTVEIAYYEWLLFICNLLSFAWIMGMKNAFLAYFPSLETTRRPVLIFNLALVFVVLAVVAATVLYGFQDLFVNRLTRFDEVPFLSLIALYLLLTVPTILTEFIYLVYDKAKQIVRYGVWIYGLQVAFVSIAIWIDGSLRSVVMALLAWAVIKCLYFVHTVWKYGRWQWDGRLQKAFALFSIPLILHMLLGNGMEYIDGIIVTNYFGEGDFAIFRYGARELPLATILVGALVSAMIPVAVQDMGQALHDVRAKSRRLMIVLYPISIGLILLSPLIYPLVYSTDFRLSALLFNIYLLILTSRILLPQVIVLGKHRNHALVWSALVELAVNIGLSLWWLQYWGLAGIAAASVVAYLVNKCILMAYSHAQFGIRPSQYLDIRLYMALNLLMAVAFFIALQYI